MARSPKWTPSGGQPRPEDEEETEGKSTPAFGSAAPLSVRSLEAEQLPSVFQPIVDLATGKTFAFEALVRCTVDRYASPFGLFERATVEGVCGRLGRRIRDAAFARCPDQNIFVNLHPHELSERWLVRTDDPICYHDQSVFLEITESATLEYFDLCLSVLKEVCARTGAHLVVDDLGAGYSNLMRVVELEPAIVKLDRALVTGIDENTRKRKLVTNIVNMCTDLGAQVVAEGIETRSELLAVRDIGVHYGQGYFLARPGFPLPDIKWPFDGGAG